MMQFKGNIQKYVCRLLFQLSCNLFICRLDDDHADDFAASYAVAASSLLHPNVKPVRLKMRSFEYEIKEEKQPCTKPL